jgi:hypothetical protein
VAIDYKQKYQSLRSKFAKETDRYFRTGYEAGMKEGQMQAQQEQMEMQRQQEMMQQGIDPETGQPMQGGVDPQTGEPIPGGEQAPMEEGQAPMEEGIDEGQGSELDQHINELESLVSKGSKPKVTDLRKAIDNLTNLRKTQKQLKSNHKEVVVSKQKDFVDGIMKKWEKEANDKSVTSNLEEIIASEGIEIK